MELARAVIVDPESPGVLWSNRRRFGWVTALIAAIEPIASANNSISRNKAKPVGG